jgi:regulator of replication initiation timing
MQVQQLQRNATAVLSLLSLLNEYVEVAASLMLENEQLMAALNERTNTASPQSDGGAIPGQAQPSA